MVSRRNCIRLFALLAYTSVLTTTFFTRTDARVSFHNLHFLGSKISKSSMQTEMSKPKGSSHINIHNKFLDPAKPDSYGLSSPFSLPPLESLAPISLPDTNPAPFCINASPCTPQAPTTSPPESYRPHLPFRTPPPSPHHTVYSLPPISPSPNPPIYEPSLPSNIPSPPKHVPNLSPPTYQPPVISPPPSVPPPPHKNPQFAVWCVAKPTVPDSIIQEALDYACGTGADCKPIQPNGPCFQPNTMFAHASYAFNSYWQKSKKGGGTCDFGGTAMLVTIDPSYDDCHFITT